MIRKGVFKIDITFILLLGLFFSVVCIVGLWVAFEDLKAALVLAVLTTPISFAISFLIFLDVYNEEKKVELLMAELNVDQSEIIYEKNLWYTAAGTFKVEFQEERFFVESIRKIVKTGGTNE